MSLSTDKGKSWSFLRDIESGEGEYAYPCLIEDNQGRIHLVYTESRYRIKHVQFDLEWLKETELEKPLVTTAG